MVELENFGWNIPTLSFLGTVLFALLGAWGLVQQIKKIWSRQSGESVSVLFFLVFSAMFSSFFVQGIERGSAALVISSILRVPFILVILYGLWMFKGFTKIEMVTGIVLTIPVIYMTLFGQETPIFLGLSYLGASASVLMPWEIWRGKTSGAVSLKAVIIFFSTVIFWVIYGFSFRDFTIVLMAVPYVIVYGITIVLLLRYHNVESMPSKAQ